MSLHSQPYHIRRDYQQDIQISTFHAINQGLKSHLNCDESESKQKKKVVLGNFKNGDMSNERSSIKHAFPTVTGLFQ